MRMTGRPLTIAAMLSLLPLMNAGPSLAQNKPVKTFASAEEAANALVQAAKTQDEPTLEAILGAGPEVLTASDDSATQLNRRRFSEKYTQMHRLVREPDGSTVLYVGAENWPFPFPLTQKDGKWSFDTIAGLDELLYRTIGQNEMTALEICNMIADADASDPSVTTTMDAKDKDAMQAHVKALNGGGDDQAAPLPFYGYYFQRVKAPSTKTKSGARARSNGDQLEAVEVIAYPIDYRSSGVMTFLVMPDGVVYEKDLGPDTPKAAPKVRTHKTGSGWSAVSKKTATTASASSRK